jgi:pyridoxine kinase
MTSPNRPDPKRILSIQSHVVTGYVGNRSATFPLQLLGWEVDVVNTTQLSNHTGYGRFGGMRLDAEHLQSVFDGMEKNGLLRYGRVLTGYTPSPSALSVVSKLVQRLRDLNADLIYLLDPVLGDMGRGFYVDKGCLPIYQELMASATIICPNQFEAQVLAEQDITSIDTLRSVVKALHARGTPNVIITSVVLPDDQVEKIGARLDGGMILVGSTALANGECKPWCIQFTELEDYFVGVGDLFSALTLGNFSSDKSAESASSNNSVNTALSRAAERAVAAVQSVLRQTLEGIEAESNANPSAKGGKQDESEQRVDQARRRELKLVQSRAHIEHPQIQFRAKWIP